MGKMVFVLIALFLLFSFVGLNLGKWLDVTEKPVKSDIIVCLGGGKIDRVKKSIELFEEGYAGKQVFFLIGESWYNQPYIKTNHPDMNIVIDEGPKNTKEEVLLIKRYMKEHGYNSALIVTDPPHSRRVSLLTSLISVEGDEALKFHLAASPVKWWDSEHYYGNKRARIYVEHEIKGILYTLLTYGFLNIIGLEYEMELWKKGRKI